MKSKNCKQNQNCARKKTDPLIAQNGVDMRSPTDPNGSYTGRAKNKTDRPTQDADDL